MVHRTLRYHSTPWKVNHRHTVAAFAKVFCLKCFGITNIEDHSDQDNDGWRAATVGREGREDGKGGKGEKGGREGKRMRKWGKGGKEGRHGGARLVGGKGLGGNNCLFVQDKILVKYELLRYKFETLFVTSSKEFGRRYISRSMRGFCVR